MTGKHVTLIGGSSGIGLAVAKLLAQRGARLTVASRSADRLRAAAAALGGVDVRTATIDTLDEPSVRSFFERADPIDHLVCLAGDSMGGGVLSTDLPAARRAVESKFWGQFYVGRYGGPRVNRAGGSLTFTSGSGPRPHQAVATVAANAGVSLLSESLAKELAPVRVNVVAPYYVDSPMWDAMEAGARRALFDRVSLQLPIGFVARPEDVASTFVHVIESTYLNGVTIPVNGGALLQTID